MGSRLFSGVFLSGFALTVYKDVSFTYMQSSWPASYNIVFIP